MSLRIFIPRDAGAVAVGADEVAIAFEQAAAKRKTTIEIIRTGSRGLYWLEPMVEVATAKGRVAFGPVTEADAAAVLDAMAAGSSHRGAQLSPVVAPGPVTSLARNRSRSASPNPWSASHRVTPP